MKFKDKALEMIVRDVLHCIDAPIDEAGTPPRARRVAPTQPDRGDGRNRTRRVVPLSPLQPRRTGRE